MPSLACLPGKMPFQARRDRNAKAAASRPDMHNSMVVPLSVKTTKRDSGDLSAALSIYALEGTKRRQGRSQHQNGKTGTVQTP